MTTKIYNKSIKTGELQLVGLGDKLNHFGIVGYLMIFPTMVLCFHLVDFVRGNTIAFREDEIWITITPAVFATIAYCVQKQRLK